MNFESSSQKSSIELDELEFIINQKFKQGYKLFSVFQGHGPQFKNDPFKYPDSVGEEKREPIENLSNAP